MKLILKAVTDAGNGSGTGVSPVQFIGAATRQARRLSHYFWLKSLCISTIYLLAAFATVAQTNPPAVRLAIVSETPAAATAADVLTAGFSGNEKLHLLERAEIEKIYREQGMSAGGKDFLKLGQLLGADGLLLLDAGSEGTNQFLNLRLVAVKPGVVLLAEKFFGSAPVTTEWASSLGKQLDSFWPKLAVLPKDALPISVVNLRSATASAAATEMERQLKLLTIQRLSREPQLFVLERQKMQSLGEEKNLNADESAFWNGSYLLDGVVDQNGFSPDTVTINARLTPPKGGAAMTFEASGSRTNLSEVINRLAAKVTEMLKVNMVVKEWNAADEAAQYFDEAKWAYGWGLLAEARAAVESAWALGRNDQECAIFRIATCLGELPEVVQPNVSSISTGWRGYHFTHINDTPDPKDCDAALSAIRYYYELIRALPDGNHQQSRTNQLPPDTYQLGIGVLTSASKLLWHFSNFPASQEPVREKLAELRAKARSVADLIEVKTKSQKGRYPNEPFPSEREFWRASNFLDDRAIFECKLKWGCFWRERPEDAIALYRELITMPSFRCGVRGLWADEPGFPRVAIWNQGDKERAGTIWRSFLDELDASTNYWLCIQAKGLICAHARTEACLENERNLHSQARVLPDQANRQWHATCEALLDYISTNYEAIVGGNEQLATHDWGMGLLFRKSSFDESSQYTSRFADIQRNYLDKIATQDAFQKKLNFLKENKPYGFFEFVRLFGNRNYTEAQALEILPLLASYKSNLTAQSQSASGRQKSQLVGAVAQVGSLENEVNRIAHAPVSQPQLQTKAQAPKPFAAVNITTAASTEPIMTTNIVMVKKFFAIPLEDFSDYKTQLDLPGYESHFPPITAHHWVEGKLLLDFDYSIFVFSFDEKDKSSSTRMALIPAIAIFDLATEHWDIITGSEVGYRDRNNFYHRTTFLHGELFTCDGGQIKKYDFQSRRWKVLEISDGGNYALFAVNGELYAANENEIFEIVDDGKGTRLLTSIRRRPAVSTLDSQGDMKGLVLFSDAKHSLRAGVHGKVYTWINNDWREDGTTPPTSASPEITAEGLLFRHEFASRPDSHLYNGDDLTLELSFLASEKDAPELWLRQKYRPSPPYINGQMNYLPIANVDQSPKPLWETPAGLLPAYLPAALHRSDLYLLAYHSKFQKFSINKMVPMSENLLPNGEYHAALMCFSGNLTLPQKILLKFEAPSSSPPVSAIDPSFPTMPPGWMLFTSNSLIFGLEYPRNHMPNDPDRNYKPGVWLLPLSQVEPALAAQKYELIAEQQRAIAKASEEKKLDEQRRQAFLKKYDRNHNGTIDHDEQEAAMEDPYYIKYRLKQIHAQKQQ